MISWPATLPQVPARNYEEEMESGIQGPEEALYSVRTRTYPEHGMTFGFRVSMNQWRLLRGFYNSGTTYGQQPFTAPWLAGLGFPHHFCRFKEPPTLNGNSKIEGRFDAEISVEIISGVPMSGSTITYGSGA